MLAPYNKRQYTSAHISFPFQGCLRELALEISLTSLGSNQIFLLPQLSTEAAKRFWVRKLTLSKMRVSLLYLQFTQCLACLPFHPHLRLAAAS
jgi:hypothetical protein